MDASMTEGLQQDNQRLYRPRALIFITHDPASAAEYVQQWHTLYCYILLMILHSSHGHVDRHIM